MSYIDIEKKYKRGPQIITRKDAASIIAKVGLRPNWKCLDLGGGSGFLSLFIANLVPNGSVACYELKKEHADIIKENITRSGFSNIKVFNKDAALFAGKNFDLITMDVRGADKIVPKAALALKKGGFLAAYSPHIEQQIEVLKAMTNAGLVARITENIEREWTSVEGFTHPRPSQVVHTGFVAVGRKD